MLPKVYYLGVLAAKRILFGSFGHCNGEGFIAAPPGRGRVEF